MRIAITGASGMLGHALRQAFETRHEVHALGRQDLDVTSIAQTRQVVGELKPDWILHAAAFTRVDDAESESVEAHRVNALGTRNLAAAACRQGSSICYYSSDYVFDGRQNRPYRERDPVNPLSEYGRSKLAGELFARELCPRHLIVRTSWLFGPNGSHFVDKIQQRAQATGRLSVLDDQRGCPTYTPDLAELTLVLVENGSLGTYHVTNSGDCTWYEFAREIISLRNLNVPISRMSSVELKVPAPRPAYSVLDNHLLKVEGISLLRPWQSALEQFLKKQPRV
ncbi:MAG: dTDP-4-dehydrorhamnose reductase [Acidobacteriota bacterium]